METPKEEAPPHAPTPSESSLHPHHHHHHHHPSDVQGEKAAALATTQSQFQLLRMPVESAAEDENTTNGPHASLHHLIADIGALNEPTHDDLDEVWLTLPSAHDLAYPTASDCPDVVFRQAELLRLMIVLYDRVSAMARQEGISPDAIYHSGLLEQQQPPPHQPAPWPSPQPPLLSVAAALFHPPNGV